MVLFASPLEPVFRAAALFSNVASADSVIMGSADIFKVASTGNVCVATGHAMAGSAGLFGIVSVSSLDGDGGGIAFAAATSDLGAGGSVNFQACLTGIPSSGAVCIHSGIGAASASGDVTFEPASAHAFGKSGCYIQFLPAVLLLGCRAALLLPLALAWKAMEVILLSRLVLV